MTRHEFIKRLAKNSRISEALSNEIINNLTQIIAQELIRGEAVNIRGFGKFYTTEYKGRDVISPQGEKIAIKGRISPRFKPSKNLKALLKTF